MASADPAWTRLRLSSRRDEDDARERKDEAGTLPGGDPLPQHQPGDEDRDTGREGDDRDDDPEGPGPDREGIAHRPGDPEETGGERTDDEGSTRGNGAAPEGEADQGHDDRGRDARVDRLPDLYPPGAPGEADVVHAHARA